MAAYVTALWVTGRQMKIISTIAKGYFIADAAINYTKKKWEAGLAIQNLFNTKWKETQFDTESRLQNEPAAGF